MFRCYVSFREGTPTKNSDGYRKMMGIGKYVSGFEYGVIFGIYVEFQGAGGISNGNVVFLETLVVFPVVSPFQISK